MTKNNSPQILESQTSDVAQAAENLLLKHADQAGFPFQEKPLSLTALLPDESNHPVGYLEGISMQRRFYLSRLAVFENARGQGIGSALLSRAEEIARKRGDAEFVLDTWNFQAEDFYARQGYQVIGRLDNISKGAGKVWMSKKL